MGKIKEMLGGKKKETAEGQISKMSFTISIEVKDNEVQMPKLMTGTPINMAILEQTLIGAQNVTRSILGKQEFK